MSVSWSRGFAVDAGKKLSGKALCLGAAGGERRRPVTGTRTNGANSISLLRLVFWSRHSRIPSLLMTIER